MAAKTVKTSSTKKSAGGESTASKTEAVEAENIKVTKEVKPTRISAVKEPVLSEMIMCRSVFPGKFYFSCPKTKMIVPFEAQGDVNYIEYQDLRAAMTGQYPSINRPYIVIEDEEILELPIWKKIKELYESLYALDDIKSLLRLSYRDFKVQFEALPMGIKRAVSVTVSGLVQNGEFDEMRKIKIIDEACDTDIALLIS